MAHNNNGTNTNRGVWEYGKNNPNTGKGGGTGKSWDNGKMPYDTDWDKFGKHYDCGHWGNMPVFTLSETSGTLFAGGLSRGVMPDAVHTAIDLTGTYTGTRGVTYKGAPGQFSRVLNTLVVNILTFPIPDFGVPSQKPVFWVNLAADVADILNGGNDMVVFCQGGHGRTGMVLAILAAILVPDRVVRITADPIEWVRAVYCMEAVETKGQENYVYRMVEAVNKLR